jgi:hypothetical protein
LVLIRFEIIVGSTGGRDAPVQSIRKDSGMSGQRYRDRLKTWRIMWCAFIGGALACIFPLRVSMRTFGASPATLAQISVIESIPLSKPLKRFKST